MQETERETIEQAVPADHAAWDLTSPEEPSEDALVCCVVCGKHPTAKVLFVICPGCRTRITAHAWKSTPEST